MNVFTMNVRPRKEETDRLLKEIEDLKAEKEKAAELEREEAEKLHKLNWHKLKS